LIKSNCITWVILLSITGIFTKEEYKSNRIIVIDGDPGIRETYPCFIPLHTRISEKHGTPG